MKDFLSLPWLPVASAEQNNNFKDLIQSKKKFNIQNVLNYKFDQDVQNQILNEDKSKIFPDFTHVKILIISEYTFENFEDNFMISFFRKKINASIDFYYIENLNLISNNNFNLPNIDKYDFIHLYLDDNYIRNLLSIYDLKDLESAYDHIFQLYSFFINSNPKIIINKIFNSKFENFFNSSIDQNLINKFINFYNSKITFDFNSNNNFFIFEVDKLINLIGYNNFCDRRFFLIAKYPFSNNVSDFYAYYFSNIIASLIGLSKKMIILDLDNTLWGGEVGENDIYNLKVGNDDFISQSFFEFQKILKLFKKQGILLSVVSKNDYKNAVIPFEKISNMPLQIDDFVSFKANWKNKSQNINDISKELNLSLDSMVFFDDNIFERNLVRNMLSEVFVPEIGDDPVDYSLYLEYIGCFINPYYNNLDKEKNKLYSNINTLSAKRNTLSTKKFEKYLKKLETVATIKSFQNSDKLRVIQLFSKTNQFNLTKLTIDSIIYDKFKISKKHICLQINLKDKITDHGLISAMIIEIKKDSLVIKNWVMSCRVFERKVEDFLIIYLLKLLKDNGREHLLCDFISTHKNTYAKKFINKYFVYHTKKLFLYNKNSIKTDLDFIKIAF